MWHLVVRKRSWLGEWLLLKRKNVKSWMKVTIKVEVCPVWFRKVPEAASLSYYYYYHLFLLIKRQYDFIYFILHPTTSAY